jgi:hypothetical protein
MSITRLSDNKQVAVVLSDAVLKTAIDSIMENDLAFIMAS